jgi:hypothetical protein
MLCHQLHNDGPGGRKFLSYSPRLVCFFLDIREACMGQRQIALPFGVARIGLDQAIEDSKARLIGVQRRGQVALASCTPPTSPCATAKSLCPSGLPGSDFANWSKIGKPA